MNATEVTAGLAESNGSLLPGLWRDTLHVTCGLTACTSGSAPGPTLGNEYGKTLLLLYHWKACDQNCSLRNPVLFMCCVKPLHYQELATTIDHELAYFGNRLYGTTTQCYRIGISFLDNMKLNVFKSKPSTSVQLRLMQTYEGRQFAKVKAGMWSRSRGLSLETVSRTNNVLVSGYFMSLVETFCAACAQCGAL